MEACLTGEEHGATSSESVLDWVCLMWGCFRCWLSQLSREARVQPDGGSDVCPIERFARRLDIFG